ncbi:Alpha/Beta hydrolase protein [Hypoxylon sp. FL1284]|nr:Alpha/Beta hydrolase protein [Hypoxylon sp. FL1284]
MLENKDQGSKGDWGRAESAVGGAEVNQLANTWLSLAFASASAAEPVVELAGSKVTYRGTMKNDVEHFQNVRYAHDTSGHRRFAPPELYTPPEGSVVDATAPGPACPQLGGAMPSFFDDYPEISEDCLNLRIARPAGTTAADKLPVVVYLYGSGVVKGSAYDSHYDPDNLITLSASLKQPVIYVSLNHRLSFFGFARLPWVKDNIEAFGGDPARITAFGTSAGGTFISLHTTTYGGEKGVPFTQAWTISGPPGTALNVTSDATETHTLAVAKELGCEGEDEDILTCLREVPMEKLKEAALAYAAENRPPIGLFTFIPSIDDDFIPDRQSVLLKAGKVVKGIPMVTGWAQDDGASHAGPAEMFQTEEDMKTPVKDISHRLTDADFEDLFSRYPASDFEKAIARYEVRATPYDPVTPVHYFRASRIMRDMLFTCSSIQFGYEMSKQSRALDAGYPGVRLYDMNQSMLTDMFTENGAPYFGPAHGSDTNYIFNGAFPEGKVEEEDQKLSEFFAGSFINFAYTGTPSAVLDGNAKTWPESFPGSGGQSLSGPSEMRLNVIGGPLGTGSALLTRNDADAGMQEATAQIPLMDSMKVGEMESEDSKARQRELEREKLLERCAYISTLSEKLGV